MASQLVHIQSGNEKGDNKSSFQVQGHEPPLINHHLLVSLQPDLIKYEEKEDGELSLRQIRLEEIKKKEPLEPQTRSTSAHSSQSSISSQLQQQPHLPGSRVQAAPQKNRMADTISKLQANLQYLPDCLCKNGQKAIYICSDEECSHFKSLKSRLSYERYYCEECMYAFHNHLPMHIIIKTFELGYEWDDLDCTLVQTEKQFKINLQDHMDLLQHYEEVAADKEYIQKKSFILPQLRELDQIKADFQYEAKESEESIDHLRSKFKVIELLEIKEAIRKDFEKKIGAISRLAMIDSKKIGPIYKDVIEISGPESIQDLYKEPHSKQLNRDMYIGLKFESMNELRRQDAEKIKNLEKLVQELLQRLSVVEGKKSNK